LSRTLPTSTRLTVSTIPASQRRTHGDGQQDKRGKSLLTRVLHHRDDHRGANDPAVQSETQLIRKLAARIQRKRCANLDRNENPQVQMAVTPRVYLHRQRERVVDEQILEPTLPNQNPPSRTQPFPTNRRESVRAQTTITPRVYLHRQGEMAVDEQTLEPISPNQDPPSRAQPFPTHCGEIVKRKAFLEETISLQV